MSRDRVRIDEGQKRIGAYLGGKVVADTTHPKLVWEKPCNPACSFPKADDAPPDMRSTETATPPSKVSGPLVAFDCAAMGAWVEEHEEIFGCRAGFRESAASRLSSPAKPLRRFARGGSTWRAT